MGLMGLRIKRHARSFFLRGGGSARPRGTLERPPPLRVRWNAGPGPAGEVRHARGVDRPGSGVAPPMSRGVQRAGNLP